MDVVKYFKERERMCNTFGICLTCNFSNGDGMCCCEEIETKTPEEAAQIVEQWSKENPIKTNKDALLEIFPMAQVNGLCLDAFTGRNTHDCGYKCEECWNSEYKHPNK